MFNKLSTELKETESLFAFKKKLVEYVRGREEI